MAPRTLADDAEGAAGAVQATDVADLHRAVVAWVRTIYPNARNLRLICDVPGEDGLVSARLPIASQTHPADLKGSIVAVLSKLRPGEWMKGRNVAWEIDEDLDNKSGSFKRAVAELVGSNMIESDKTYGYRLKIRG